MSKMNLFVALNLIVGVSTAFAGTEAILGGGNKGGAKKPVTFEEMKDRCANPYNQPDIQRQPQEIVIRCSDVRLNWVAGKPGAVNLTGARNVTGAITSSKFDMAETSRDVAVEGKGGTCNRFAEVQEMVAIERGLTCDELLGIKGDIIDFCAMAVDASKGSNPKLVSSVETGRVIDTCGAASITNGKGSK
jgi:hypothetical protein